MDDRDPSDALPAHTMPVSRGRHQHAFPKRMRAGLGGVGVLSLEDKQVRTQANSRVDVGKMLSTLDKGSLLQLMSRLLSTSSDPTLVDQVFSLIPIPSMATVEASLEESERSIRSITCHAGEMRPEFAWGRLRNPVSEFVATALGLLPFFIDARDLDIPTGSTNRDAPHATTTFSFLHLLTSKALQLLRLLPSTPASMSMSLFSFDGQTGKPLVPMSLAPHSTSLRLYQDNIDGQLEPQQPSKLTSSNPNMLVSQLIPALLVQWTHFIDNVSRAVNEEGRMFGSETAKGWLVALEALARPSQTHGDEAVARLAIQCVRQSLDEQIGWLVAGGHGASTSTLRSSSVGRSSTHMDEEEEL